MVVAGGGVLLCIVFLVGVVLAMLGVDLSWWQDESNRDGLIVTLLIINLSVLLMKR
jgi:hypothetical protein